jgi:GR25 family glycosyltransferase involved in LPS biosynthesis
MLKYKIYVVNLKKREDRKNNIINIFNNINFNKYSFYEAIDGNLIDLNIEIKNLFHNNDFNSRKGFIGCALSNYNLWINLIKDNLNDFYVIFEDDIILVNQFKEKFNYVIDNINKIIDKADIIFLGYTSYNNDLNNDIDNINISFNNFDNNNYLGGTFSYIITKNGAYKMLDYIEKNGIKHGIDYLFKINKQLNIFILDRSIVASEWVCDINGDSDIQKDYNCFNFNSIYNYQNYLFIEEFDYINNDIDFKREDINTLIEISNNYDDLSSGFNTVGYIKSKIYLDNLQKSVWFNNSDGIFIKLDRKQRIKVLCDWCSSYDLCNEFNVMSKNNYTWNNIKITHEDNDIDYYIIINKPNFDPIYIPKKTIIFQMEPSCSDNNDINEKRYWGTKTWGIWENPDVNKFLEVRTHKKYYNNCTWQLPLSYNYFMNNNINKELDCLSIICSSKYFDPGHIKRIDFLKYIENRTDKNFDLHVYGTVNDIYNFKYNKGLLNMAEKDKGIIPYKYYFMIENNFEKNYITEKLWEPIISESLCFYYGAPNVNKYINPLAFVSININNFEESFNIINDSIKNNLWNERIHFIREEKYKILNYYNFFPTVERIITKDLWKLKIELLNKYTQIYILKNNKTLNYKILPFIQTLKDFNFNVDIINKDTYNNNLAFNLIDLYKYISKYLNSNYNILELPKYTNFIIINDNNILNDSLNNLFNHIELLPNNYDICNICDNNNSSYIIENQINSLYYNVKKYFTKSNIFNYIEPHIISKKGITKILDHLKLEMLLNNDQSIYYNSQKLFYNLYDNMSDLNFYTSDKISPFSNN